MSLGQMIEDLKLALNGKRPVCFYGRTGGSSLVDEILESIELMRRGEGIEADCCLS